MGLWGAITPVDDDNRGEHWREIADEREDQKTSHQRQRIRRWKHVDQNEKKHDNGEENGDANGDLLSGWCGQVKNENSKEGNADTRDEEGDDVELGFASHLHVQSTQKEHPS